MAASVFLAKAGCSVRLYEKNEKLGKKLYITGKGRCNFTNACPEEEFLSHVVTNPRFLYSAFAGFTNHDAIRFFEELGLQTKVERGNRAFPVSDHSSDVIRVLERELRACGVKVSLHTEVRELITEEVGVDVSAAEDIMDEAGIHVSAAEEQFPEKQSKEADDSGKTGKKHRQDTGRRISGVRLADGTEVSADAVIVATGGLSYPSTGSTGDGYRFAEQLAVPVTVCRPSLVPLLTEESYIPQLQGLSLKNVTLTIRYGKKGKKTFQEFGEMLFTHEGISGPLVLSASAVTGASLQEAGRLPAEIDLKPALTEEQLDARILREFEAGRNKALKNVIASLLPAKMRPVIMACAGIAPEKPVHDITKAERQKLIAVIKAFPLTICGQGSYREAVITQGGVSVKAVNPKTMECKTVRGLYFIGEVLDLDAVTGGFNLQIAWSTAHAAAEAIAEAAE
ncbi:MAG: NAD(P)/FAD-dependent oxidoreductase [Eubacterium sp.]|nr:NAD(P)/FAD-dependent oxidoreductase [Eubacterium sp.]